MYLNFTFQFIAYTTVTAAAVGAGATTVVEMVLIFEHEITNHIVR